MTPRDLVIYGAGAHGRDLAQLIDDINTAAPTWRVAGFVTDDRAAHGTTVADLPVLGDAGWLDTHPGVALAVAVGHPAAKRRIVLSLASRGAEWPTLVHPSVFVGRRSTLGPGTTVLPGAIIMTDVVIGPWVTINIGCHLSHDCRVDDFATIAPGASLSGYVRVGEGSDIGTGAAIIQGVSVGAWSVVGAGAAVVRDLPPNCTAVGVPARVIKQREPGWHERP